jgi:hypothetical protein
VPEHERLHADPLSPGAQPIKAAGPPAR